MNTTKPVLLYRFINKYKINDNFDKFFRTTFREDPVVSLVTERDIDTCVTKIINNKLKISDFYLIEFYKDKLDITKHAHKEPYLYGKYYFKTEYFNYLADVSAIFHQPTYAKYGYFYGVKFK